MRAVVQVYTADNNFESLGVLVDITHEDAHRYLNAMRTIKRLQKYADVAGTFDTATIFKERILWTKKTARRVNGRRAEKKNMATTIQELY